MIIKDIKVYVINAPLDVAFQFAQGWVTSRSSVVVEVIGADGTSGFGECLCHGQQPPQIAEAFIENCFKPRVIGKNSLDVDVIWEDLYNVSRPFGQYGSCINAISGLDIAIWDLNGKELGCSVSTLLGGRYREKVLAYATGFYRLPDKKYPEEGQKEALGHIANGFKAMKLKAGYTPEVDIEYIRAVREAVGWDIKLMVDFNCAYNQATARRLLLELQDQKIEFFEELLPPEDMKGYQALRNMTSSYIASGENMFGKITMKNWLEAGALDIYQQDLCSGGGFTEMKKMLSLAQAYNTMMVPHVWGSGIGLAASLQFVSNIAPSPLCTKPVEPMLEFDTSSHPFRLDLIYGNIEFKDGYVHIPNGVGIGVDVNRGILEKYKIN